MEADKAEPEATHAPESSRVDELILEEAAIIDKTVFQKVLLPLRDPKFLTFALSQGWDFSEAATPARTEQ